MSFVENNKFRFNGKNKKEYIPSKLFPLSKKTKVHWFGNPNTSIYNLNEEQKNIINSLTFERGRCYTNTEKLVNALKGKLNLKFFSGWVFVGNSYPVHHAWGVLFKNKKEYIFDMGILSMEQIIIEIAKKYDDFEKQREFYIEKCKEIMQLENAEKYITGKIRPQNILYIGVESSKEQAIKTYHKAVGDDPSTHPSYSDMQLDEKGRSKTQRKFLNKN